MVSDQPGYDGQSYRDMSGGWRMRFALARAQGVDSRVGVLGANGAGKSTLLNLITGVLQPSQGAVSNHAALTPAQSSKRRADRVPYDKSPIDNEAMAWRQQLSRFGLSGAHQTSVILRNW
jgi:ATP-binding cassette subfamily F protein 2